MELVPQPLAHLIRRAEREPSSTKAGAVFDLPRAKQWNGTPAGLDLSRRFHGERAANVLGPAAGPQTQLAQNIALSYLAGARILELKTVQIMDRLQIPRPCIDATNVGFNVEWSQELRIEQSRDEYVKAALLIAALRRLGLPEGLARGPDEDYLLDLSLGYDLAGVSSERITQFVRALLDARPTAERLLSELPAELARYRALEIPSRLVSCVTLSTFHGCPSHEIEKIARYLLEELGVHVVVKLNPTLLGHDALVELLHERLGYRELTVRRSTFEKDLGWDDALAMIGRLRRTAHQRGLAFGVKLTNTLVVDNHKSFFTEKEMYLSGQPLHVLSTQLLAKLRRALPVVGPEGEPPVVYSFSAGIDQHNFPLAAAADLHPVTTCTDLLRPGGYGRLPKYLENLAQSMRGAGAANLDDYVLRAHGVARRAMAEAEGEITREATRRGLGAELSPRLERAAIEYEGGGVTAREVLERHVASEDTRELALQLWVHAAGTLNTEALAKAALDDPRYRKAANDKAPKKIGSTLVLFDCVSCDKCVPVCPNDANFAYEVEPLSTTARSWRLAGTTAIEGPSDRFEIGDRHQLATFVDACNACGNCDVFCPEDGGPYVVKPHWFGGAAAFEAESRIDGFYLESRDALTGRIGGARVRLAVDRASRRVTYENAAVIAHLDAGGAELELLTYELKVPGEVLLRGADVLTLIALLDGVQETVNPVSAALEDPARGVAIRLPGPRRAP